MFTAETPLTYVILSSQCAALTYGMNLDGVELFGKAMVYVVVSLALDTGSPMLVSEMRFKSSGFCVPRMLVSSAVHIEPSVLTTEIPAYLNSKTVASMLVSLFMGIASVLLTAETIVEMAKFPSSGRSVSSAKSIENVTCTIEVRVLSS
jgi:hypothetical protein